MKKTKYNRNNRRGIKSIKGLKLCFAVIILVAFIFTMPQILAWVQADVITGGEAVADVIPSENGEKGTKQNPFVILEIVPYEGYAEIGYLIEGCEPIDMDRIRYSGDMTAGTISSVANIQWKERKQFPDEVGIPSGWEDVNATTELYGYYEKVENNKGVFREVIDSSSGKIDYVKVGENQGDIIWRTVFTEDISIVEEKRNLTTIGDKVYMYRTDNQYKKGYAYSYDHKHHFLKEVLGISENKIRDYEIVVKTIEPRDLNNQLSWIDRADLISISPRSHDTGLVTAWENYNLAGKPKQQYPEDFAQNDLSWDAVIRIFKKVNIEKDYAGLILDITAYESPLPSTSKGNITSYQINYEGNITSRANATQAGNSNNVYKLILMSKTMNPVLFYNLFLNEQQGPGTALIQDGSFTIQKNDDARRYWNQSTFTFTLKDGGDPWTESWEDRWNKYQFNPNMGGNESVSSRTYTYIGNNNMTQGFLTDTIASTKYTKEFHDYIAKEEISNSPAHAIRYILGEQEKIDIRDKDIKVLDLEPCKDFKLNSFYIRMLLPHYIGKIDIVHMTSAEFIGKIEDLNSTYDMIYMGMNYGMYNTRSRRYSDVASWKSGLQLPDYNDNALDGKIYLHVGDKITGNRHGVNWISELLPSGTYDARTTRMPGNDITEIKKKHLVEFIDAGYPVLVESMLYNTGSELTDLVVDKTSNIYSLISNKKSKDNVINVDNLPNYTASTNIVWDKPVLQLHSAPKAYVGISSDGNIDNNNYINSSNPNFRNLNYSYTIIDSDDSKRYEVRLFIDANSDGRFNEDTELNMVQRGMAPNRTHNLTKRLSKDYFGVIPWKLQIVDESNSNNRDEVSGMSAVKNNENKQTIKVLQVNRNSSSTLNLSTNQRFKDFTKNLNDFKVEFTTESITQFENRYSGMNYFDASNNETKLATDRLSDYNMLIFGFGDTYGPITNGSALKNIEYFIESGKSVLFTHDITSFNNTDTGMYGYYFNKDFRDMLGMDRFGIRNLGGVLKDYNDIAKSPNGISYSQQHGYTYYSLKRIADGSQNMTYKDLVADDDNNTTKTVTKLNDGQITQYPYAIDDTIRVADTHAQYYQLNLDDPSIVVWYCLGKNNSDQDAAKIYDISPNDASNNYYIYNKGNITYSGVGHSDVGGSDMEVKLFVNTMIAAYRSSVVPPMIEILNEEECIFNPGEVYGENEYLDIEFIPWDFNLSSQELGVKVYIDGGSTLELYDKFGNKMNQEFISEDGSSLIKLENGNTYAARYKRSIFTDTNLRHIKFYIENNDGKFGFEDLMLKERVLFNLY